MPLNMSVYLIQPPELFGTSHYVLGTKPFRKESRILIQMETSDPDKVEQAICLRFQEWHTVKDNRVEGDPKVLRSLFYMAFLTYEDSLPVKMDIDEPPINTLLKYLKPS